MEWSNSGNQMNKTLHFCNEEKYNFELFLIISVLYPFTVKQVSFEYFFYPSLRATITPSQSCYEPFHLRILLNIK